MCKGTLFQPHFAYPHLFYLSTFLGSAGHTGWGRNVPRLLRLAIVRDLITLCHEYQKTPNNEAIEMWEKEVKKWEKDGKEGRKKTKPTLKLIFLHIHKNSPK